MSARYNYIVPALWTPLHIYLVHDTAVSRIVQAVVHLCRSMHVYGEDVLLPA